MTRGPVPSSRAVNILTVIVMFAAVAGSTWLVGRVLGLGEDVGALQQTTAAQDQALDEANRRLEARGLPPVPVPETPTDAVDGEDGADGATGPMGPPGIGLPGARGPRGFIGPVGPAGPPGSSGATGPAGAIGPPGAAGEDGDQGPAGAQGETGAQGPAGPAGSAEPGTYTCPDGQYVAGFTIGPAGGVTLDCRDQPAVLAP